MSNNAVLRIVMITCWLLGSGQLLFAQDVASQEIVRLGWKASNDDDLPAIEALYRQMMDAYETKALEESQSLNAFPLRDVNAKYQIMNDAATILFIKGECLMHQGKSDEAKAVFNTVIKQYPWAQAWDPSRGAYWSIKEKSQASIDAIDGKEVQKVERRKHPRTSPTLAFPGQEVVDFTQYGKFQNVGTKDYHFSLFDNAGLAAAQGEGIYPNLSDLYKDPQYKKALQEGRLKGKHWDFVDSDDMQAAIYKWSAISEETAGVRLFYKGAIFERAHMYFEAIKCYQSIVVFFPSTIAWTYWQTPWYPGQAAIAKIKHIIRDHPELRLVYKGAKIRILNGFDNDPKNDVTITSPGKITQLSEREFARIQSLKHELIPVGKVVKQIGKGAVRLVKFSSGHWQLLVKNKPYLIKGVTYEATKIGQSADKGTITSWMDDDLNKNGKPDGPYDSWIDANGNGKQDPDEPVVGDLRLMKDMGVNTIRLYHQPLKPNKEVLRQMFKQYGFRVIMGDFLGKYAIGSGATWSEGTDYTNPVHRKKMMQSVKDMVMEYKDEPFILFWLIGNENNYGVASNADKKPNEYFKFVNEVALMIKSIDKDHPVAICNGDTLFLDKFAKYAPDVDIYGSNAYRGDFGFGSFWDQVAETVDKPAFITEYGAPAYAGEHLTYEEAQEAQAAYHRSNWLDILHNSAGYDDDGVGNAIGGVAFQWMDEWWKNYEPFKHDTRADTIGPFAGGYYYEEWFGIFGQGEGKGSPFLREERKVYDTYQALWNSAKK